MHTIFHTFSFAIVAELSNIIPSHIEAAENLFSKMQAEITLFSLTYVL